MTGPTAPTASACRQCGAALAPDARFCAECGAALTGGADPGSPWGVVLERLRRATLGEFEIQRELGRGGMAAVFLAHEIALNRPVAIKVMAPGLLMGEGMVERFRREAVTVAGLSHPNIVTMHAVRQADDLHFFVMQFVSGRPLDAVLAQDGRLPVPVVRSLLFQTGTALAHAHRHGVIHRDVKPANVLLDTEGNAVVTDFGIAKVSEAPGQTQTGMTVGTPAYMSPEQCDAGTVTWASDQYSLGAVAYELLTGSPPFQGTMLGIMQAHVSQPPPPLRELRPDCPPDLEAAVLRMLAKRPHDRFPSMSDALRAAGAAPLADDDPVRAELVALATGGAGPVTAPAPPVSPAPPSRAAMAAVTALDLSPAPSEVRTGDVFRLAAEPRSAGGAPAGRRVISWSSTDPGVATVSADGTVTARRPGAARIQAVCEGIAREVPLTIQGRRRRRAGIGTALVGVGIAVAIGGGWFVLRHRPAPPAGPAALPPASAATSPNAGSPEQPPAARPPAPPAAAPVAPAAARLGTVRFEGSWPAGAVLMVDGRATMVPASRSLEIAPGAHQLQLTAPGYRPAVESVAVAAAARQTVRFAMESLPSAPAPAPPPSATLAEPNPAPPPAPTPAPDVSAEVRQVILAYAAAINARSLSAMRTLYPGLPAELQNEWSALFGPEIEALTVTAAPGDIAASANLADARFTLTLSFTPRGGEPQLRRIACRASLRRDPAGWRFVTIDQRAAR